MKFRTLILIFTSVVAINVRADLSSHSFFKQSLGEWTGSGVTDNPQFAANFRSVGSSRVKISRDSKVVTIRGEIQRQDTKQMHSYTLKFIEKKDGEIVARLRSEDDFNPDFTVHIENGGSSIKIIHTDEKTGLNIVAKAYFEDENLIIETKAISMGMVILTSRDIYKKN